MCFKRATRWRGLGVALRLLAFGWSAQAFVFYSFGNGFWTVINNGNANTLVVNNGEAIVNPATNFFLVTVQTTQREWKYRSASGQRSSRQRRPAVYAGAGHDAIN